MLKSVLSIVVGVFAAMATIMLMEMLGHAVYPPPEGVNFEDPVAIAAMVATLPIGALLMVILAYAVGALVGGIVAGLIKPKIQSYQPIVVGAILTVFGLMNLMMIPHPIWFWVATLLCFVPFAFIGGKIGSMVMK